MAETQTDAYWQNEFDVTAADLDRLAEDIEQALEAAPVTALARNIVRRRLLYGPDRSSRPAASVRQQTASVLWFDQIEEPEVGDQLVVLHTNRLMVQSAEVTAIEPVATGIKLHVFLPDQQRPSAYIKPSNPTAWSHIQERYREKRFGTEKADAIESILLVHGDRIARRLYGALRTDERFVRLSGRWFLRKLAFQPTESQIQALAWALVQEKPRATDTLAQTVTPGATGDRWLFGVYLALREHCELFRNVNPGPQPLWDLAGPPPGPFTPQRSAYDPETFEVIAQPGAPAEQRAVNRLWELDLLDGVV